jgi:hypothetical protein
MDAEQLKLLTIIAKAIFFPEVESIYPAYDFIRFIDPLLALILP